MKDRICVGIACARCLSGISGFFVRFNWLMRTLKCGKKARATYVVGLLPLAEGHCWFVITLGSPLHLVASSRNSLFHFRIASYC